MAGEYNKKEICFLPFFLIYSGGNKSKEKALGEKTLVPVNASVIFGDILEKAGGTENLQQFFCNEIMRGREKAERDGELFPPLMMRTRLERVLSRKLMLS